MSDLEDSAKNFLRRWSQRKRAAEAVAPGDAQPAQSEAEADRLSPATAERRAALSEFDPATLPPIESITATSDVRPFLAPSVPEDLRRAALRRVWMTDPTIRDFVGIAENQWDFANPDSVPGFGSLELTPELQRIVTALVGHAPEQTAPPRHAAERSDEIAEISAEPAAAALALVSGRSAEEVDRSHAGGDPVSSLENSPDSAKELSPTCNDDAVMQKNSPIAGSPQSAHRKHGGAVPK